MNYGGFFKGRIGLLLVFAFFFLPLILFLFLLIERSRYFAGSPKTVSGQSLDLGRYKSKSSEFINGRVSRISGNVLYITVVNFDKPVEVGFTEELKMGISVAGGPVLEFPKADISSIAVNDIVWVRFAQDGQTAEQILVHKEK